MTTMVDLEAKKTTTHAHTHTRTRARTRARMRARTHTHKTHHTTREVAVRLSMNNSDSCKQAAKRASKRAHTLTPKNSGFCIIRNPPNFLSGFQRTGEIHQILRGKEGLGPSVCVTVRLRVLAKPSATAPVRDVKNTRRLPRLILSRIAKTMESATVALAETTIPKNQHNVVGIDRDDKWSKRQNKTKNVPILGSSRRPLAGAKFLGVKDGPARISGTLQTESAKVHEVGDGQRKATRRGRRGGRRCGRLHERKNFCRRQETPEFSKAERKTTPRG